MTGGKWQPNRFSASRGKPVLLEGGRNEGRDQGVPDPGLDYTLVLH